MSDPGEQRPAPNAPSSAGPEPPPTGRNVEASPRPADPERGLRGVMSAILVFEAVTILLGLTVIANGGVHGSPWQIIVVSALALLHLAAPAIIARRYAVKVIWVLQALLVGCWAIHAAIGAMGIVFGVVWALVLLMRREFRRRLVAGTLAGAGRPEPPQETEGTGT